MLSVLARGDVDPWEEAARLARLPAPAATERLTELILASCDGQPAAWDSGTIAARVVALLPRRPAPGGPFQAAKANAAKPDAAEPGTLQPNDPKVILVSIIVMALLLGAGWFAASRQPAMPASGAPQAVPRQ
jgi:hypothetical protein